MKKIRVKMTFEEAIVLAFCAVVLIGIVVGFIVFGLSVHNLGRAK
jgi:hypothetical protein